MNKAYVVAHGSSKVVFVDVKEFLSFIETELENDEENLTYEIYKSEMTDEELNSMGEFDGF